MPPHQEHQEPRLTVVATASGMLAAEILKAKLESAGIEVLLHYESAGQLFGITLGGHPLSEVRLLVAEADAADAKRILETPPPQGWDEEASASTPEP
ncbi:MAG: DUF2007 domain-containing protein [Anaerolineae bacterium]|nr:DUF2007 domain-containing protein [Anaerolineae bacterium]